MYCKISFILYGTYPIYYNILITYQTRFAGPEVDGADLGRRRAGGRGLARLGGQGPSR